MIETKTWLKILLFPFIFSAGMLSAGTDDNPIQSLESIRESAKNHAWQLARQQHGNDNINIEVGSLDKRLRLAQCSQALTAFDSPNTKSTGRTTVGVRCEGDKSWKIYIAVDIQVIRKIAILKNPLTRNSVLKASDIVFKDLNIASLHRGYYTRLEPLIGKHVKNALQGGTVITPAQIKNPLAIKKGSQVTILADLGGIQVRMKGKALKSGSLGDWISVRNMSSNRQIEGRILEDGVIQVTL